MNATDKAARIATLRQEIANLKATPATSVFMLDIMQKGIDTRTAELRTLTGLKRPR